VPVRGAVSETVEIPFVAGPPVADGAAVRPGDLVIFGSGPASVHHVGLYVGSGLMVDAPSHGQNLRLELPLSSNFLASRVPPTGTSGAPLTELSKTYPDPEATSPLSFSRATLRVTVCMTGRSRHCGSKYANRTS